MGLTMRPGHEPQSSDPQIQSISRAYVVYEQASGDILHVHHVVEIVGGPPPLEPPRERALRLAGVAGRTGVEVLEVEPAEVNHGRPMRVDRTRQVVVVSPRRG